MNAPSQHDKSASLRWSKISLAAGITLNRFIPPCNQIIDYYMMWVQRVTSVDLAWPQKAKSDDYAATKGALGSNPSFCAMAWGSEKKSIKTLCQNADWLLSKRQICVSQSSHFFFSPSQGWWFTTKEGIKQYNTTFDRSDFDFDSELATIMVYCSCQHPYW